MADETIIYNVVIETGDLTRQAAELRKTIDELKARQKDLDTSTQEGRVQFEANAAAIRDLQSAYRQTTKDIDNVNKQIQAETGSIAANRAELARLTAEYIKQGKPTAEQTARIKALSDRLKEQEKAIGDNRRNVGNYAESFGTLLSQFNNAPGALGAVATGFNTLGTAIATGTGGLSLLIPALISLFQIFQTNAAFADGFSFALAGIGKAFQFVIDQAIELAGPLTRLFTEPKKALADFGEFLVNNFINRFKAIGVIARATINGDLKGLSDGFIQLAAGVENGTDKLTKFGKGVLDAGQAGFNAAKQLDALESVAAKIEGEIALINEKSKALQFTIRDISKSFKERRATAEQVARLEIEAANKQVELAKQEQLILKEKLKNKTLSGEEEAELERAKTKVLIAEEQARTAVLQKQTRINILLQREQTKEAKNTTKDKKAELKTQQDDAKKAEEERQKQAEADAKKITEIRNKEYQDSLKNIETYYKEQELAAKNAFINGKISEEEYNAQLQQIQSDSLQKKLTVQQDYGESTIDIENEIADKSVDATKKKTAEEVKAEQDAAAEKKAIQDATLAAAGDLADSLSALGAAADMNGIKSAELQKSIAVFNIAVSTAEALAKGVSAAQSLPFPANLISTASTVTTILANIARANAILNAAPKQFYEGGYTGDGDPHERSNAIGPKPYIYHKREYVIPHQTLENPFVSDFVSKVIEPMRRGNPSMGLIGFADGGFVQTGIRNEISSSLQSSNLAKAISQMRPVVRVSEINDVQTRVSVIDRQATL